MIVLVETNFIMELALDQPGAAACQQILELTQRGDVTLMVPAYSFGEPYEAMTLRHKARQSARDTIKVQRHELSRSQSYQATVEQFEQLSVALAESMTDEENRLDAAVANVAQAATIIPLTADVVDGAIEARRRASLEGQDAIVYSSVLAALDTAGGAKTCFVTVNRKHFDTSDLQDKLAQRGCKIVFSFAACLGYVRHELGR